MGSLHLRMGLTLEKDDPGGEKRHIPDVPVPLYKSTSEIRRPLDYLVMRTNKYLLLFMPMLNWFLTLIPERILIQILI